MGSISKTSLSILGMYIFMVGITVSSMLFGAQSFAYYLSTGAGIALSIPFLYWRITKKKELLGFGLAITLAPTLMYALHSLLVFRSEDELASWPQYFGITGALLGALISGLLSLNAFRRLMTFVAATHLVICVWGLLNWSHLSAGHRFSALGLRESVWAEVALGTVISALLTRNTWLIAGTTIAAAGVIYATQMRGAGISVLLALFLYAFYVLDNRGRRRATLAMLFVGPLLYWFLFGRISEGFSELLLLNDPHRGLTSGFSGRFENWAEGLDKFLGSPIIGVGVYDPVAGYTHNGYLKVLAQLGLVFAVPMFLILVKSFLRAWRSNTPEFLAAIFAYMIFIGSAPRYINLQLMPFVSLAAIAFVMQSKLKPSLASTSELKT